MQIDGILDGSTLLGISLYSLSLSLSLSLSCGCDPLFRDRESSLSVRNTVRTRNQVTRVGRNGAPQWIHREW